jgi:hypothetical protein
MQSSPGTDGRDTPVCMAAPPGAGSAGALSCGVYAPSMRRWVLVNALVLSALVSACASSSPVHSPLDDARTTCALMTKIDAGAGAKEATYAAQLRQAAARAAGADVRWEPLFRAARALDLAEGLTYAKGHALQSLTLTERAKTAVDAACLDVPTP